MSESLSSSDRRIGGWAGIAAAIVFAVSTFMVGPPPDIDAPAEEIATFVVDNRSVGLLSTLLVALALPLFILFAGSVRDRISDEVEGGLAGAGALAGVLFMLMSAIATVTIFGIAWVDGTMETMSADVAQQSWNLANVFFVVANPLAALFLAVVGLAGLRGALKPWLSWATLVIAVVLVIGVVGAVSPDLSAISFLGLILFTLWILVTGIVMVREA